MSDSTGKRCEQYWIWGTSILLVFLIYTISLTESNQRLFLWVNHFSDYTGDGVWSALTICGDGLVVLVCLLPWNRRHPDVVWATLLALILSTGAVQGLKFFFLVPRPFVVLGPQAFHLIGKQYVWGAFPSGHTATVFVVAGVWMRAIYRGWLRIVLLMVAGFVAISRIVVGAHWPLDILGGALIGWFAARIGLVLSQQWPWGRRPPGEQFIELFLRGAAIILLIFYDTGYSQSILFQRAIALFCLFLRFLPHNLEK